jgi:hypothetical protein
VIGDASARQAAEYFRLFGAPQVVTVTTDRNLGVPGAIDCGVWLSLFVLSAHSLGIGAIPQAALALHSGLLHGEVTSDLWCREVPLEGC